MQLVLLGEASHGTAEFYAMRAELSKMLVGSVDVGVAVARLVHSEGAVEGSTLHAMPAGAAQSLPGTPRCR